MFSIILILLLLALLVIMILPAIILSFVSNVLSWFGIGKRKRYTYTHTYTRRSSEPHSSASQAGTAWSKSEPQKRKKLFDKSDGEYVDFEEIKD